MLPYINRSASLYDDPASVQFHCKEQFLQNHKRLQEHAFGTLNSKILQHTTSSRRIHYNTTTADVQQFCIVMLNRNAFTSVTGAPLEPNILHVDNAH